MAAEYTPVNGRLELKQLEHKWQWPPLHEPHQELAHGCRRERRVLHLLREAPTRPKVVDLP